MGVMRFVFDPPELFDQYAELRRGYITGLDGRVHPTRIETEGSVVSFRRQSSDSGKVHLPYPVDGHGRPVLTTASLPEREQPYILALELLRGKLSDIRDQAAAWEQVRMTIPDEFRTLAKTAFQKFAHACLVQEFPVAATREAREGLSAICEAANVLMDAYVQQRSASLRVTQGSPPTLVGCTLDRGLLQSPSQATVTSAITSAIVPIEWSRIEPTEGEGQWQEADFFV